MPSSGVRCRLSRPVIVSRSLAPPAPVRWIGIMLVNPRRLGRDELRRRLKPALEPLRSLIVRGQRSQEFRPGTPAGLAAGTSRRPDPCRQRTGQRRHDGRENRRTGAPTQRVRPPQRSSLRRDRPPTQILGHQECRTTKRPGRALADRPQGGLPCWREHDPSRRSTSLRPGNAGSLRGPGEAA